MSPWTSFLIFPAEPHTPTEYGLYLSHTIYHFPCCILWHACFEPPSCTATSVHVASIQSPPFTQSDLLKTRIRPYHSFLNPEPFPKPRGPYISSSLPTSPTSVQTPQALCSHAGPLSDLHPKSVPHSGLVHVPPAACPRPSLGGASSPFRPHVTPAQRHSLATLSVASFVQSLHCLLPLRYHGSL